MPSMRYVQLAKHIEDLRQHLLPTEFVPTGIYPSPSVVQTQTAAFIVMVHAEFEAYFEDRAEEIAIAARDSFMKTARACRTVTCLLGFVEGASKAPGVKVRPAELGEVDIKSRVKSASDKFIKYLRTMNNGIKENDLAAVLLPIGVPYYEFDSVVLARLNTLGSRRGEFVHAGRARYVAQHLDPQTQYDELRRLVADIDKLDKLLDELLMETKPQT